MLPPLPLCSCLVRVGLALASLSSAVVDEVTGEFFKCSPSSAEVRTRRSPLAQSRVGGDGTKVSCEHGCAQARG